MTHLRLIFSVVFLFYCVCAQDPNGGDKMKCYNDRSEPIRCVPEFVNAAFRRKVISNNTCGTPPTKYCVQTLSTGQKKECQTCDNRYEATRHTPFYITDIKDDKNYSWWQSDTLYTFVRNGLYDRQNRQAKVVLTLDLGKTFEVVSIRLRFRSLRPESMAIFKRTTADQDGPWIPYQYYSRSCSEFYNVEPNQIVIDEDDVQTALCTAEYSQVVPIFGGEVLFRTLANRPGRNEIERLPQLQDWIRAYSLKFELDRLNTFGDNLFGDPNVLRSYYYAIIDLTVVGKCLCNGHASVCEAKNGQNYVCECEHNTTGVDCERCLPTHNNKPWGMATRQSAHACEGMRFMYIHSVHVYHTYVGVVFCPRVSRVYVMFVYMFCAGKVYEVIFFTCVFSKKTLENCVPLNITLCFALLSNLCRKLRFGCLGQLRNWGIWNMVANSKLHTVVSQCR